MAIPQPTVLITDCDHGDVSIESAAAGRLGYRLVQAQCVTEAEVITAARDSNAVALLTQYAPVTEAVLAALPAVRAVGRYGVGVDTIDVDAATRHGVAVCNVPDYGTEDVSDHAIALSLALLRGLPLLDKQLRRNEFSLDAAKPLHRFSETVFGVFGLGLIGEATARKARAIGFQVIGVDPRFEPGSTTPAGTRVVTQDELFSSSHLISLHLPLLPQTHHIIGAKALRQMRTGVKIVNTCRGGIIDTVALIEALNDGQVSAAALDVFEVEPLPSDSRLRDFEQVLITPHAAWYSEESFIELKSRAMENILDFCSETAARNLVNPSIIEQPRAASMETSNV